MSSPPIITSSSRSTLDSSSQHGPTASASASAAAAQPTAPAVISRDELGSEDGASSDDPLDVLPPSSSSPIALHKPSACASRHSNSQDPSPSLALNSGRGRSRTRSRSRRSSMSSLSSLDSEPDEMETRRIDHEGALEGAHPGSAKTNGARRNIFANGHGSSSKKRASSPSHFGFVSPKRRTTEAITIDDSQDEIDELEDDDDDNNTGRQADDEEIDELDQIQDTTSISHGKSKTKGKLVAVASSSKFKAKATTTAVKGQQNASDDGGKRVYCHQDPNHFVQDHQAHDSLKETMWRCSAIKTSAKGSHRACGLSYCEKCLKSRYEPEASGMNAPGARKNWSCPLCRGICEFASARRRSELVKQNLAPVGYLKSKTEKAVAEETEKAGKPKKEKSVKGKAKPRVEKKNEAGQQPGSKKLGASTNGKPTKGTAKAAKTKEPKASQSRKGVRGPFSMNVDTESSLSSLSSDEDKPSATTAGAAVVVPVKRRNPPPRAPKFVRPPKTYPLTRSTVIPSNGLLIARLHLRSFILRFSGFAPVLTTESAKIRSVLGALADDRDGWVWSREGDVVQRFMLQALCELLDQEEENIATEEGSAKLLRRLAREAVGSQIEKDRAWDTLREIVEQENVWDDGGWGEEVVKWEAEREEADRVQFGGQRETRGRRGETGPDERLALMLALVELAYAAECVRKDFTDGVEAEKTAMVTHNRSKFQHRHDCEDRRKAIFAEKPEKPKLHIDDMLTDKDQAKPNHDRELAEWAAKCADIDDRLKEEEKKWQKELNEIHRDVYLVTAENRLRFAPTGTDVHDNQYWLMCPSTASKFPTEADPATDDYPLSWSILVHGSPFSEIDPVAAAANGNKGKTIAAPPPSPPPTPGTVASINASRVDHKDSWFVVTDPEEMIQLVSHLEWQHKWAEYEVRLARHEKSDAGTRSLTPLGGEDDESTVKSISDLVAELRIFADYVAAEKEDAVNGNRKARKNKKRRF
ncbi:BQ5605_C037g11579 [Microbotryum silenes-dioicae]|uniref:BQ5605_C037g11579 protein n=1 Tax=Microbotryum silenes-dioicae TaxID=796604 RepID=A0A2X0PG44_9BASI|nr:BQ5605_C037g11579 [Microbotryum silenes-dioicae]